MSSRKSLEERFWSKVDKSGGPDACWIWTAGVTGQRTSQGRPYKQPMIWDNGKKRIGARIAWELATGLVPAPNLEMCHTCDNCMCVNPQHLYLGTHSQNMLDAVARGRHVSGMLRRVLDADKVRGMHTLRQAGYTYPQIAERYGITSQHVGNVLRGYCWHHIYEEFHGVQEQAA